MSSQREMPKYICHKEVWALKIASVVREGDKVTLSFKDDGYAVLDVSLAWAEKHNPHEGGYYVVYKDGYVSYSPEKAFEDGYARK